MSWTQEDIVTVYRAVKDAVSKEYSPNKSKSQLITDVKLVLKRRFGYRIYYSMGSRKWLSTSPAYDKKYKRFVKDKYHNLGLPSKERNMLDNMINSVVDSLECNEISLNDLKGTVSRMDILANRAKTINSDCDNIVKELEKISSELEAPCSDM